MRASLLVPALLAGGATTLLGQPVPFGQEIKLTPAVAAQRFGYQVALSGDTAAITAGSAVDIYVRSGAGWTLQQRLTAADTADVEEYFGGFVALAGDTLAVPSSTGTTIQAVHVFVRSGSNWTEQQKLVAADAAMFDGFGRAMALSGDTLVIGSWSDDTASGQDSGSAYVYVRSGSAWTQQQKLLPSEIADAIYFGWAVAISGDSIVVGGLRLNDDGAIYVFVRSGATWTEQQRIPGPDVSPLSEFGSAVAIDGDTLVVNNRTESAASPPGLGVAYVYLRSGSSWSLQQRLAPSQHSQYFGTSLSLEGDTLAVGATHHNPPLQNAGAVYVFDRSGATWTERQRLTAADRDTGDALGRSVALRGDTLLAGADLDDSTVVDEGSVYSFRTGRAYHALNPCRLVDTRVTGPALGANTTRTFTLTGACGVPADAAALAANLVAVNPGDLGDLRVFPTGSPLPTASTLNFAAGRNRANSAALPLGAGGAVDVRCTMPTGSTAGAHFVLDVFGYFR
jgi:hypothetical protein